MGYGNKKEDRLPQYSFEVKQYLVEAKLLALCQLERMIGENLCSVPSVAVWGSSSLAYRIVYWRKLKLAVTEPHSYSLATAQRVSCCLGRCRFIY